MALFVESAVLYGINIGLGTACGTTAVGLAAIPADFILLYPEWMLVLQASVSIVGGLYFSRSADPKAPYVRFLYGALAGIAAFAIHAFAVPEIAIALSVNGLLSVEQMIGVGILDFALTIGGTVLLDGLLSTMMQSIGIGCYDQVTEEITKAFSPLVRFGAKLLGVKAAKCGPYQNQSTYNLRKDDKVMQVKYTFKEERVEAQIACWKVEDTSATLVLNMDTNIVFYVQSEDNTKSAPYSEEPINWADSIISTINVQAKSLGCKKLSQEQASSFKVSVHAARM